MDDRHVKRYEDLAATLRRRIADGTYPAGSDLPTVQQMSSEHGVTISTVQAAMQTLRRDGLVDSGQGRRSRVLAQRAIISHSASYLAQDGDGRQALTWAQHMASLGMRGEQILGHVGEAPAPEDIAQHLGVAPGDPVLLRGREMLADGEVVELADSWYPLDIASGTGLAQRRLVRGGLPAVLAERGLRAVEVEEIVTSPVPGPEACERLRITPDDRILRKVRVYYAEEGQAVAVDASTMRGSRHELRYRLPVH
ncbi:GntR family transcriptional regulator [Streptomyces xiamenensis]|uniref:GntR family transcriptional regulator n=1 Tax=Streptomyces xiamenensis TaxID=408015 RepID=UPI0037D6444A